MTMAGTSYRSKIRKTRSTFSGRTESIIRSWLSETQISQGASPSSFSGTFSRSTSAPKPPPEGHLADHTRQAAPAEVFQAVQQPGLRGLDACMDERLLQDRIAQLDGTRFPSLDGLVR